MQAWDLGIERVDNGFVVSWWEELEAEEFMEHKQVFEAGESEWGDHEALVACLRFVVEHFGLQGSKHDGLRISMGLAPPTIA